MELQQSQGNFRGDPNALLGSEQAGQTWGQWIGRGALARHSEFGLAAVGIKPGDARHMVEQRVGQQAPKGRLSCALGSGHGHRSAAALPGRACLRYRCAHPRRCLWSYNFQEVKVYMCGGQITKARVYVIRSPPPLLWGVISRRLGFPS